MKSVILKQREINRNENYQIEIITIETNLKCQDRYSAFR